MIKPTINYALWLLGIRKILPREFILKIVIEENGEELVQVSETPYLKISKDYSGVPRLRKTVFNRLSKTAENLPVGYTLILIEGFRPLERQRELWEKQYAETKNKNPKLSPSEIERRTRLFVAKPTESGGHQTGGAVDVTLGDKDGNELFLGTKMHEFSKKTRTQAGGISPEAKNLRMILLESMRATGFVNYPSEWWHFSYGDRLWAAYSRLKKCQYGQVK